MSFTCLDCNTSIPGSNCAYTLSHQNGWKKKAGCYFHCKCGYPVRAAEVRDHIFTGYLNDDQKAKENAYIYCETKGDQHHRAEGHVYYGTFDTCVTGNGLAASGMSSVGLFKRYSGAK